MKLAAILLGAGAILLASYADPAARAILVAAVTFAAVLAALVKAGGGRR